MNDIATAMVRLIMLSHELLFLLHCAAVGRHTLIDLQQQQQQQIQQIHKQK